MPEPGGYRHGASLSDGGGPVSHWQGPVGLSRLTVEGPDGGHWQPGQQEPGPGRGVSAARTRDPPEPGPPPGAAADRPRPQAGRTVTVTVTWTSSSACAGGSRSSDDS